jgi:protein involved in polysaccharide export with SLBB domain
MRFGVQTTVAAALLLLVLFPCEPTFAQRVGTVPLWQGGGLGSSPSPGGGGGTTFYPPTAPGTVSGTETGTGTQGHGTGTGGASTRLPDANIPRSETNLPRQPRQRAPQVATPQEVALPFAYTEERSAFEDYVLTGTPGPLSFDIRQFGYDVFRQPGPNIAQDDNVPVGPGYVIGPGDEVRVNVWGSVEGQWQAFVDRDGTLSFPKIGSFVAAGLSFEGLRKTLEQEMQRYYTDFQISVTLGQLHTVRVYATGNFLRPGEYTVSSFATLIDVLFQSGGPSKNGSMRDIELKRGNKTIAHFDAYDLLLKGSRSQDLRLMADDIIFVPNVGPLVGIAGNVKKPAIFELKGPTHLTDLIAMAGGLRGLAFKGRVQVQRVSDNQYITAHEVDLLDLKTYPEKNVLLQDGDLVKIFAVAEAKNLVTVNGAIFMPGEYGISPGVTKIRDIIGKAGGPQYYASSQAELTRLVVTPAGPTTDVIGFDLQKAMEGDPVNNLVLEKNDYVLVRAIPGWKSQQGTQQLDQWQQQVMQGASPATSAPASASGSAGGAPIPSPSTGTYMTPSTGVQPSGVASMAPGTSQSPLVHPRPGYCIRRSPWRAKSSTPGSMRSDPESSSLQSCNAPAASPRMALPGAPCSPACASESNSKSRWMTRSTSSSYSSWAPVPWPA